MDEQTQIQTDRDRLTDKHTLTTHTYTHTNTHTQTHTQHTHEHIEMEAGIQSRRTGN